MATKKSTTTTTTSKTKAAAKDAASTASGKAQKAQGKVQDEAEDFVDNARKQFDETTKTANERFDAVLTDAVKYGKDVSFTTIGLPFALQNKLTNGKVTDLDSFKSLIDDAKAIGEKQYAEFEKLVEPYVKQITGIVDPAVDKVESLLPTQVQDMLAENRRRFEKIVNDS